MAQNRDANALSRLNMGANTAPRDQGMSPQLIAEGYKNISTPDGNMYPRRFKNIVKQDSNNKTKT